MTDGEHIVAVHPVGEDRGVPFLAMPLLRVESLDDRVKIGFRVCLLLG